MRWPAPPLPNTTTFLGAQAILRENGAGESVLTYISPKAELGGVPVHTHQSTDEYEARIQRQPRGRAECTDAWLGGCTQ